MTITSSEQLPLASSSWVRENLEEKGRNVMERGENSAAVASFNDRTDPSAGAHMPPDRKSFSPYSPPVPKIAEHDTNTPDGVTGTATAYWGRFNLPETTARPISEEEQDVEEGQVITVDARADDRKIRHAFLRKVYSILSAQMLLTFGICALMTLHKPTQAYVLENGGWLLYLSIALSFVILFMLLANKNNYPTNIVLLGIWTLAEAYLVGTVTAVYAYAGNTGTVLEAVFLTGLVFVGLSLFTLQSKWDFSFMGAGLGMCLMVLVFWSILGMVFGFQTGYIYALIGTIVFSGYVIFDTYMISERLDPEDYIIAVIELYLDIINLFLFILRLLGESDN